MKYGIWLSLRGTHLRFYKIGIPLFKRVKKKIKSRICVSNFKQYSITERVNSIFIIFSMFYTISLQYDGAIV